MLHTDALVREALAAAGSDDLGADTWREGLEVLVDSAVAEARLDEIGVVTMETQIRTSLVARAQVTAWTAAHPEVLEAPIEAPVFILGLPRCGTTLLSYLLDADPANRSLLRGECFTPVPPPSPGALRDHAGVRRADAEMDALYSVLPEFKAIHYETGSGPTECITVLGQDLRSVHFETMANLPTYSDWHLSCDMRPAYDWHRRVLSVLQSGAGGRWVLKSPCHNLALDALVDTYPDARFVVPHRDPVVAVGSLASLVTVLSGLGTDHDWRPYIGPHWLELAGRMLEGMLAARSTLGEERFFDIDYRDLVADAPSVVVDLYRWLGWDLTDEAEAAMGAYLARATPGRFGRHTYDLADVGLDEGMVRDRVSAYLARFPLD